MSRCTYIRVSYRVSGIVGELTLAHNCTGIAHVPLDYVEKRKEKEKYCIYRGIKRIVEFSGGFL